MAVLAWATVWVLPAGVLILLALMPGGVPTRQVHANPPPTATAGTTTSTPLSTTTVQSTRTTIAPGTAIRGCIYVGPATSTPIEMAYMKLFTSGEEFTFVADTFSNEQGYYQSTGMAAGTYEAHICAYDYEYIGPGDTPGNAYEIPGGLRVALGDTTVADAYLDPEAIVTGQVTISVGPLL